MEAELVPLDQCIGDAEGTCFAELHVTGCALAGDAHVVAFAVAVAVGNIPGRDAAAYAADLIRNGMEYGDATLVGLIHHPDTTVLFADDEGHSTLPGGGA